MKRQIALLGVLAVSLGSLILGCSSQHNSCSGSATCGDSNTTGNSGNSSSADVMPLHLIAKLEGCPAGWYTSESPSQVEKSGYLHHGILAKGGVPVSSLGDMQIVVTATASSEEATLVNGIHVNILKHSTPQGIIVQNTSGCGANSTYRLFDMDLDQTPAQVGPYDNSFVDPIVPKTNFPVSISTRESETFELDAFTNEDVTFGITVDWSVGEKSGHEYFDNGGAGFHLAGPGTLPEYAENGQIPGTLVKLPASRNLQGPSPVCGEIPERGTMAQVAVSSGVVGCTTALGLVGAYLNTGQAPPPWQCTSNAAAIQRSTGMIGHCAASSGRIEMTNPGIVATIYRPGY